MMHGKHNLDGDCMAELYEYLVMVTALQHACMHIRAMALMGFLLQVLPPADLPEAHTARAAEFEES